MADSRHNLRLLEALLFASDAPLDEETIRQRLPGNADPRLLLAKLQEHYRDRGINLVQTGGKWTMRTSEDLGPELKRHLRVRRKPSRAAIETLAIVAYHQPITRAEIDEIRGVGTSRGTFDVLVEAGWIAPRARRRTPGRPMTWATTQSFLEHFGLNTLDDLPKIEELRDAGFMPSLPPELEPELSREHRASR